jgi:hypothetical protein
MTSKLVNDSALRSNQQPHARFISIYTQTFVRRGNFTIRNTSSRLEHEFFTIVTDDHANQTARSPWMLMTWPPNRIMPKPRIAIKQPDIPPPTLSLTAVQECLACTCVRAFPLSELNWKLVGTTCAYQVEQ